MSIVNYEVVRTKTGPVTKILNREVIRVDLLEKVVDRLLSIEPGDFNMRSGYKCIYGHARHILTEEGEETIGMWTAAVRLGIPFNDDGYGDSTLFYPPGGLCSPRWSAGPEEAVKVIRHLIATGKIDWSKSGLAHSV